MILILTTEDKEFSPLKSSIDFSMEQKDWCTLEAVDDSNDNVTKDVTSTSEGSIMGNFSGDQKN